MEHHYCVWPGCYEAVPVDQFLCTEHLPLRDGRGPRAATARKRIWEARSLFPQAPQVPIPEWVSWKKREPISTKMKRLAVEIERLGWEMEQFEQREANLRRLYEDLVQRESEKD